MEPVAHSVPTSGGPRPSAAAAPPDGPRPSTDLRPAIDRRLQPPTPRVALLIAAAAILGFVLYLGRDVLAPFVIGLLLVYLLDPPVERLCRLHIPRWLAVLLVYGLTLGIVIEGLNLLLAPIVQQLSAFVTGLPRYLGEIDKQLQHLTAAYRGLDLPPEVRRVLDEASAGFGQRAASFDPTVLLPVFSSIAGLIASLFGYLIVPVWAFYLLKDRPALAASFDRGLPEAWRQDAWAIVHITDRVFRQWLLGQVVLGLTVGVATYAGLIVLGDAVDPLFGRYALLLATVAGLFELLPIIGPILAAIPAVMLALTMSVQAVVAVFILYLAVQQLENYLLVPKIQGDAVRLHPSAIMFALVVGGAIAGLIGAILALPVAATARDIYRYLFGRLSDERAAQPAGAEPETVPQAPAAAPAEAAAGSAWRPDATSPTDGSATPDPGAGDGQGLAGATAREQPVAAGHRPLPTPSSLIPPPDA